MLVCVCSIGSCWAPNGYTPEADAEFAQEITTYISDHTRANDRRTSSFSQGPSHPSSPQSARKGTSPCAGRKASAEDFVAASYSQGAPPSPANSIRTQEESKVSGRCGSPGEPEPEAIDSRPLKQSLLGPVVTNFQAALVRGDDGSLLSVRREPFIQGLEAYAKVLNELGGMGDYLLTNTQKLRKSKASRNEAEYGPWLRSEMPVHAATNYKSYVDDSAFMGNLWIAWTMEFFVAMFAEINDGKDTKNAVDNAYKRTLYNHHNFIQRNSFKVAVTKLPNRKDMYRRLQGAADPDDVVREIEAFVGLGQPLVQHCLELNTEVDNAMKKERTKSGGW